MLSVFHLARFQQDQPLLQPQNRFHSQVWQSLELTILNFNYDFLGSVVPSTSPTKFHPPRSHYKPKRHASKSKAHLTIEGKQQGEEGSAEENTSDAIESSSAQTSPSSSSATAPAIIEEDTQQSTVPVDHVSVRYDDLRALNAKAAFAKNEDDFKSTFEIAQLTNEIPSPPSHTRPKQELEKRMQQVAALSLMFGAYLRDQLIEHAMQRKNEQEKNTEATKLPNFFYLSYFSLCIYDSFFCFW